MCKRDQKRKWPLRKKRDGLRKQAGFRGSETDERSEEEIFMEPVAQQVTVAKPSPKEVHDAVMSFGVSDLDAGLVADCLHVGKSTTWMNNDPVADNINERLSGFLKEKGYGFEITVTPVRMGKFIWDVKKHGSRQ